MVKVLKGGTTGVGLGTSGKTRGGRSSTGDVGDVAVSDGRQDRLRDVGSLVPEDEAICFRWLEDRGVRRGGDKRTATAARASVSRPSEGAGAEA